MAEGYTDVNERIESTPDMKMRDRVAIIGSGNWLDYVFGVMNRASALSILLGKNVRKYKCFENEIKMWVYEEMIDGRKLTDIINTEHENVKYPDSNGSSESFTSRIFPVISSPRM